jgi:alkanesulfonate monooxygenase SsuD/methylene tetrahydromethanopterin reductase-like flavin-dependent oxidoreductase (luciferase family)
MTAPTTGVVFRPQQPPEALRAAVLAAEQAGVEELWLWEDCFLEGGLTTAAAALAWSERIRVGIGLLPVPFRNPAVLAMEVATLARLFPGRLLVTLGHGIQDWMRQVGATVDSPMTLLRETTVAVRDLLDGAGVTVDGRYVRLDDVRLDWPPPQRPALYIGGRGPRTVRLAGEVSDGVLLDDVVDTAGMRRDRAILDGGRALSGRGGRASALVFTEVDPAATTGAALASLVRDRIAMLVEGGADSVILHGTAAASDPRPLVEALAALA